MAALRNHFLPEEILAPERPRSFNFAYRGVLGRRELQFLRSRDELELYWKQLKRQAARALADHIAEHCKWFGIDMPDTSLRGEMVLQLELTINDRGSYENFIPVAERRGQHDGWERALKAAAASLPYGMADAAQEFYE